MIQNVGCQRHTREVLDHKIVQASNSRGVSVHPPPLSKGREKTTKNEKPRDTTDGSSEWFDVFFFLGQVSSHLSASICTYIHACTHSIHGLVGFRTYGEAFSLIHLVRLITICLLCRARGLWLLRFFSFAGPAPVQSGSSNPRQKTGFPYESYPRVILCLTTQDGHAVKTSHSDCAGCSRGGFRVSVFFYEQRISEQHQNLYNTIITALFDVSG